LIRTILNHEQWERIAPELPGKLGDPGATAADNRLFIEAVIPMREGTAGHAAHDAEKYKWRHLVENFFCAIKAFRRIATRYEKTDTCFASMINIVAVVLWTR
jgi:transposase